MPISRYERIDGYFESWKIWRVFFSLGSKIGSTIVSKSNRFEGLKNIPRFSWSSIRGHGNNFPWNDCVMKAFNTGGVTSSSLEIRTVTLRDIWKQCNFRELRSTAELMCKLQHNSCPSRGISTIDSRSPKLLPRITSLTRMYVARHSLSSSSLVVAFCRNESSPSSRLHPSLVELTIHQRPINFRESSGMQLYPSPGREHRFKKLNRPAAPSSIVTLSIAFALARAKEIEPRQLIPENWRARRELSIIMTQLPTKEFLVIGVNYAVRCQNKLRPTAG